MNKCAFHIFLQLQCKRFYTIFVDYTYWHWKSCMVWIYSLYWLKSGNFLQFLIHYIAGINNTHWCLITESLYLYMEESSWRIDAVIRLAKVIRTEEFLSTVVAHHIIRYLAERRELIISYCADDILNWQQDIYYLQHQSTPLL